MPVDFGLPWSHEVPKEDRLRGNDVSKAASKPFNAGLQHLVEPLPVIGAHQAVLEHPATLMVPQPQQVLCILTIPTTKDNAKLLQTQNIITEKCYFRTHLKIHSI